MGDDLSCNASAIFKSMTRFVHDKFAKDYLEKILAPYGEIKPTREVAGEVLKIDAYFVPNLELDNIPESFALLREITLTSVLFEPFRKAALPTQICDCLLKSLILRGKVHRDAKREEAKVLDSELPKLWILTPTASDDLLSGYGATSQQDSLRGVYYSPKFYRLVIVAIHQLPKIPQTLWLRILGRDNVQKRAIDELEALAEDDQYRRLTLELLYNLQQNLQANQIEAEEERELVMRLAPLYQQDRELAKQEGILEGEIIGEQRGIQQGERKVVENLLLARFGELDAELATIIDPLLKLPAEEFTPLLLQLSREELITRFHSQQ